jgi:hypothetical protein
VADDHPTEVPTDLERRLEELDGTTDGDGEEDSPAVDALSGDAPEICPQCGGQLTRNAVFADGDEPVAVRLTCRSTHEGGQIATYIYAVDSGDLYLEDESEPGEEHPGDGDGAD